MNKLAKFSHNPGTIHFRALLHIIGFLKNTSYKGLKFFSDFKCSNVYKLLINNNIKTTEDSVIIFSDSSWNDCIHTGRSTGGYISFNQGGPDLRCMGSDKYDQDNVNMEPARIIIDNEAAISMAKCNKDTAGNRHVARRYHYVRQGTALQEHKFEWIEIGRAHV